MISSEMRQRVRERAKQQCEYCHSNEIARAARFEIDHIYPKSLGGLDAIENLALACQRCNRNRYNFTEGLDPKTQKTAQIFNPRTQVWNEHFGWIELGLRIQGITSIGRATCDRLDLNDERNNERAIVTARRLWLRGGWHPPEGDRILD